MLRNPRGDSVQKVVTFIKMLMLHFTPDLRGTIMDKRNNVFPRCGMQSTSEYIVLNMLYL